MDIRTSMEGRSARKRASCASWAIFLRAQCPRRSAAIVTVLSRRASCANTVAPLLCLGRRQGQTYDASTLRKDQLDPGAQGDSFPFGAVLGAPALKGLPLFCPVDTMPLARGRLPSLRPPGPTLPAPPSYPGDGRMLHRLLPLAGENGVAMTAVAWIVGALYTYTSVSSGRATRQEMEQDGQFFWLIRYSLSTPT